MQIIWQWTFSKNFTARYDTYIESIVCLCSINGKCCFSLSAWIFLISFLEDEMTGVWQPIYTAKRSENNWTICVSKKPFKDSLEAAHLRLGFGDLTRWIQGREVAWLWGRTGQPECSSRRPKIRLQTGAEHLECNIKTVHDKTKSVLLFSVISIISKSKRIQRHPLD